MRLQTMVRSQRPKRARLAGVLEAGELLYHAQKDVLAQVLQIGRRHAQAIEPADDQGTVQVHQVLPGVRFAGLARSSRLCRVSFMTPFYRRRARRS